MKFKVAFHQLITIIFEPSDFGGKYDLSKPIDIKIPKEVDGENIWYIGQKGKANASLKYCCPSSRSDDGFINVYHNKFNINTLEIPEGVVSIEADAFNLCNINNLILPSTLTYIADSAFARCHIFSDLVLPPSLENIGTCTFQAATFYGKIVCPPTLRYIGEGAFQKATIKDILFDEKTKTLSIKQKAFEDATLSKISFPKGLASLGPNCFYHCSALSKVTFAKGSKKIKLIPKYCFCNCEELKTVENIPQSVKKIADRAFSSAGLTDFDFESSKIELIERCAFQHTQLTKFIAPSTLNEVGNSAFMGCTKLETAKIPFPGFNTFAHSVFSGCTALSSVEFVSPTDIAEVAYIPSRMFSACVSLENVIWPKRLYLIGEMGFARTAIKELDISEADRLLHIRKTAFSNCLELTKVKFNPFTASSQIEMLQKVPEICDIPGLLEDAEDNVIF